MSGQISIGAGLDVKEASVSATVIRCGCGDPLSHALQQLPCPTPKAVEDRGIISYYHKNPLRRAAWMVKSAWKHGKYVRPVD